MRRCVPRAQAASHRRRLGVVAVAMLGWLMASATAASAHPVGLPSFALVAATGPRTFTVEWTPAPDDLVVLARALGLPAADRAALSADERRALLAAPGFRRYLLQHASATQDGTPCAADVTLPDDLEQGSPRYSFTCPAPLVEVRLRLDPLTDLDARYRTLAVIPGSRGGDQQVLFSSAAVEHPVAFAAAATAAVGERGGEPADGPVAARPSGPDRSVTAGAFGGSFPFEQRLVALVDAPGSVGLVAGGVLLALAIGAAHALAPGHGKTIAAAYLVGDRGRPRDALLLGLTVSAMHTVSVLALAAALWWLAARPSAAALTGWLSLVSGVVVLVVGLWLVRRRASELRDRRPRSPHGHGPAHDHAHVHGPAHDHGHGHDHLLPDNVHPLSRRGLAALGAAGGLLPSPTALLVLLTALSLGRAVFGLALVGAFSVGLAATLTAVGLAVVHGREVVRLRVASRGRLRPALQALPMLGAGAVVVLGLVLTARAAAFL